MRAIKEILRHNLDTVEKRINAACLRARRPRVDITLIAVTKYVDADIARLLVELGAHDLGESRPQELWRKAAAVPEAAWHLVGHLQRNKVERTLPLACITHSVDSLRLLQTLQAEAAKLRREVAVLLEFNLSGDAAKHGFRVDENLAEIAGAVRACTAVNVVGLMTMSALNSTSDEARLTFASLRQLRDRMSREFELYLPHLSMGMTNDFEAAVEEGATMLRIGSALFEGLEMRPHD
jgi:hypothetical protein